MAKRTAERMTELKKYKISMQNSIQISFTYRFQFFSGLLLLLIPFLIKLCLWRLAFQSEGTGKISGYTYDEMILYHTFSMVFAYLSTGHFQYRIAAEIKDGTLSRYLVKPIDHMLYWGSMFAGDKVIHFIYVLVFIAIWVFIAVSGGILGFRLEGHISIANVPLTIAAVFFSMALNFTIYYVISLLAFWFLDISCFFAAIAFIISVISGEVIPIDVMPVFFERLFSLMPFSYSVYFPAQLLMGKLAMQQIFLKFAMQIFWIFLLSFMGRLVWDRGIAKYESAGG